MEENTIINTSNILLCKNLDIFNKNIEIQYFLGVILFEIFDFEELKNKRIYFCGDVKKNLNLLQKFSNINIIYELSTNFDNYIKDSYTFISIHKIPLNIHNVGVFYKSLFSNKNYFEKIQQEHNFTNNLKNIDYEIINIINNEIKYNFTQSIELNNIFIQTYNTNMDYFNKNINIEENGVIVFCTFYEKEPEFKTFLSEIKFKLKDKIMYPEFQEEFTLTLWNNSVFIIPQKTNMLYTYEIIQPEFLSKHIPKRINYIISYFNENNKIKFDISIGNTIEI